MDVQSAASKAPTNTKVGAVHASEDADNFSDSDTGSESGSGSEDDVGGTPSPAVAEEKVDGVPSPVAEKKVDGVSSPVVAEEKKLPKKYEQLTKPMSLH